MKTPAVVCAALLLTCFAPAAEKARAKDEKDIRETVTAQQDTWNRHDAKAYAALFAEDGDCVNVVGWWWKGRAEIEQKLTRAFEFVFRDSNLTIENVDVRFLTPQVAVAHARWTMKGAKTPPNIPEPRVGIQTITLQKKAGKWLMVAFQNTNAVPETPFPIGAGGGVGLLLILPEDLHRPAPAK
jgi:uncharacterized protein (TIGR02246 family)